MGRVFVIATLSIYCAKNEFNFVLDAYDMSLNVSFLALLLS